MNTFIAGIFAGLMIVATQANSEDTVSFDQYEDWISATMRTERPENYRSPFMQYRLATGITANKKTVPTTALLFFNLVGGQCINASAAIVITAIENNGEHTHRVNFNGKGAIGVQDGALHLVEYKGKLVQEKSKLTTVYNIVKITNVKNLYQHLSNGEHNGKRFVFTTIMYNTSMTIDFSLRGFSLAVKRAIQQCVLDSTSRSASTHFIVK